MAEYSLFKRTIKYAISNGVVVVAAAGNEANNCSNKEELTDYVNEQYRDNGLKYIGLTYELPGTIKGVITVSAIGKENELASYSNYGEDFIDISAPGGDMSNTNDANNMCLTTTINDGYTFIEGTSMAAPKVSAVAALIICKNKDLTSKKIAKRIYKTADRLNKSEYYGYGVVNAYNAVK